MACHGRTGPSQNSQNLSRANFPKSAPWDPPQWRTIFYFSPAACERAPPKSYSKVEIMTDADALSQIREVAARYVRLAQRLEEASDGADSA
jgi:hypothetical protein